MAHSFEWAHASAGFRLVGPDELASYAYDEEGTPGEYGLWCGDEVMLYGSLDALHTFLVNMTLAVEERQSVLLMQSEDDEDACPDDPDGLHHAGCGCE